MSTILSSLIDDLRNASQRNSISPEMVAAIFDETRREYEQLVADAASGGSVNLNAVYDEIEAVKVALNEYRIRTNDALSELDNKSDAAHLSLSERISVIESLLSETPGVVNAPAILPFSMIINNVAGASPLLPQSIAVPWYPVYYAPEKVFAARLATNLSPMLAANEKLYLSNTAIYNASGKARTDMLFSKGNDIFMHNGESLVKLSSNPTIIQ